MKKIIEDLFDIFYPDGKEPFGVKLGFLIFVIVTMVLLAVVL